ncbi:hypothetical protein Pmani_015105 [Petrolisthes manimaculis]|uniref:Alpha-1,3-mannosyl-glycoprotein 2-beta-N-acetylglucosaminyltransferase n=1 Tax=Petrolisthes manimaculis TaxID=1843537 RepID=A0AAE1PUL3_9EUCA|nr:hypothetical protein Pmani_015105 [Petrolisthes manimaculis]
MYTRRDKLVSIIPTLAVVLSVVVGVCLLLSQLLPGWRRNVTGTHIVTDTSSPSLTSGSALQHQHSPPHDDVLIPIHHHYHPPPPPLPMWGQNHPQKMLDGVSSIPILMLVTTDDLSLISRSIESVLKETGGSGFHLVVSVSSPSSAMLSMLQEYPIKVHRPTTSHTTTPHYKKRYGHFQSFLNRMVPAVSSFTNFFTAFSSEGVCVQDELNPEIGILSTGANFSRTSTYRLSITELQKLERGSPYMNHPYNPVLRRAILNSRQKKEKEKGIIDEKQGGESEEKEDVSRMCIKCLELREALKFVQELYPNLQYLILMETGYAPSPDYVSYLNQTLSVMQTDPSIYCISAYNPLILPQQPAPHNLDLSRLYRYDHFVATASLIPAKVVNEVVREFVVYQETATLYPRKTALSWLETWMSWCSRRRRRGCLVPAISRVCPLTHTNTGLDQRRGQQEEEVELNIFTNTPPACSHNTYTYFNTSRLINYQYSQDMFKAIESAEPLGTEVIDCTKPGFFPENMNASLYIIYLKMENYDDDFTFHHIMKCFGLDLVEPVGYFEGTFQFTYRSTHIILMGIPFSPYSPSIKNTEALLVADIPEISVKGQTNYRKFKDTPFNFNTVLVKQKIL